MNYFGVEKRVKVVDKMSPRDFDRGEMFKLRTYVKLQYYKVVFEEGESTFAIRNILLPEAKSYTLGGDIFGDITGTAILSGNSLEHLSKVVTIISKDLI